MAAMARADAAVLQGYNGNAETIYVRRLTPEDHRAKRNLHVRVAESERETLTKKAKSAKRKWSLLRPVSMAARHF